MCCWRPFKSVLLTVKGEDRKGDEIYNNTIGRSEDKKTKKQKCKPNVN